MKKISSSYHFVSVRHSAQHLFGAVAQACVEAAAALAYYTARDCCHSGRLTRKFLMGAPAGSYVASNCYIADAPIFAETVADSVGERLAQWARIKAAHANDRLCYLHKSRAAFDQLNRLAEFGGVFQS
jgi:hypothetical protein